jgi:hypothetical protein
MDYQQIYHDIINRGKNRVLTEYKESHHIIPRCMGGTDDSVNLVDLTPEEHYVCHLLLVKINPGHIGLVRAAMFLTSSNKDVKRNNKMYGWIKRQYSEYMRGPNNPQKLNPRSGERHHYFGKERSPSSEWLTVSGRQILTEKMLGSKNPCAGIKPWNHPRTTDTTRTLWKRADEIYTIWTANGKPSYCKLYGLCMNKKYDWKNDGKEVSPYMNMVKYFRNGWIPTQDQEWIKL